MEHILKIFYVSRETKQKKAKRTGRTPVLSAVDVGVKEKDMVIGRTLNYYAVFLFALITQPLLLGMRTMYSIYSSVSLFAESASIPARRIVSTA